MAMLVAVPDPLLCSVGRHVMVGQSFVSNKLTIGILLTAAPYCSPYTISQSREYLIRLSTRAPPSTNSAPHTKFTIKYDMHTFIEHPVLNHELCLN